MRSMENVDIAVCGAGIAGLTAAFHAKKAGISVAVLEASNRPGGVIESEKKGGFLLEHGPNTVIGTPSLLDLVKNAGLEDEILQAPAKWPRFILKDGKLRPLPMSPLAFLRTPLLSPLGKLKILREPFISPNHRTDESLSTFVTRRFGRQTLENVIQPFVSGVWAGDTDRLSAGSAFPKLKNWEMEKGSVIKGAISFRNGKPGKMISFRNGLETLPQKLADEIGESLRLNSAVQEISRDGRWILQTKTGAVSADRLWMALPAPTASDLLRDVLPPASAALQAIPYAGVAVLHFSADLNDVRAPLHGFGFLTRPKEKRSILGCLFSSSIFPDRAPAGQALLTVFMGGAARPEFLTEPKEKLAVAAENELRPILKFNGPLRLLSIRKIPRAIPQYNVGHRHQIEVLEKIEREEASIRFIGNFRGGISVGDVIQTAQSAQKSF